MYILGKHFETNYNKNSFQNTPNQSLFKNALREQHLYYLKFPGVKYYPNTSMLQITSLFKISSWDIIIKNYLKPHNMQSLT